MKILNGFNYFFLCIYYLSSLILNVQNFSKLRMDVQYYAKYSQIFCISLRTVVRANNNLARTLLLTADTPWFKVTLVFIFLYSLLARWLLCFSIIIGCLLSWKHDFEITGVTQKVRQVGQLFVRVMRSETHRGTCGATPFFRAQNNRKYDK